MTAIPPLEFLAEANRKTGQELGPPADADSTLPPCQSTRTAKVRFPPKVVIDPATAATLPPCHSRCGGEGARLGESQRWGELRCVQCFSLPCLQQFPRRHLQPRRCRIII